MYNLMINVVVGRMNGVRLCDCSPAEVESPLPVLSRKPGTTKGRQAFWASLYGPARPERGSGSWFRPGYSHPFRLIATARSEETIRERIMMIRNP
jgi:hypothetical protein